jgi:hypothetical protein
VSARHPSPKSLLAFSTMITMLTHTNRGQRLDNFESPKETGLSVLNALAVVMAGGVDSEVVAVTTKAHDKSAHLEVIACIRNARFMDDFTPRRNDGLGQRIVDALVHSPI